MKGEVTVGATGLTDYKNGVDGVFVHVASVGEGFQMERLMMMLGLSVGSEVVSGHCVRESLMRPPEKVGVAELKKW